MRSIKSDVRAAAFAALILAVCHGAMWLVGPVLANNTTTPTKPHTFVAGQTILSSQINADFDTLYSELQGNVGTANLLDSCITTPKLGASAVTTAKLGTAAVTQVKLAADAVFSSLDKLLISSASTTTIDVSIDGVTMSDGTNRLHAFSVSKTLNMAASGAANRLDTGSIAANSSYFIYAIAKTDLSSTDVLASLNEISPTMPSGYTYKRRIGSFRTTNGTVVPHPYTQIGNRVLYHQVASSHNTVFPSAASGTGSNTVAVGESSNGTTNRPVPKTARAAILSCEYTAPGGAAGIVAFRADGQTSDQLRIGSPASGFSGGNVEMPLNSSLQFQFQATANGTLAINAVGFVDSI